jgi:hypothetical protein
MVQRALTLLADLVLLMLKTLPQLHVRMRYHKFVLYIQHTCKFSADRDHAMRSIQNRTILVIQPIHLQELYNTSIEGIGVFNTTQKFQVLQYTVAGHAIEVRE